MNPAYWPGVFYILGSLCFIIGTVIGMLLSK
jgi:hypothetical protein